MPKRKYMLISGSLIIFFAFVSVIFFATLNCAKLNRKWVLHQLGCQVNKGAEQLQFYVKCLRSNLISIEKRLAHSDMKVDEYLYNHLDFVMEHNPNAIAEILILDANGDVVAGTNQFSAQSSFRESEYFKNARDTANKVYLSEMIIVSDLHGRSGDAPEIFHDPLDLGWVFYAGVYSKGRFMGMVLFVLRAEPFFNRYSMSIDGSTSGYGFILQEDGRILFHRHVELRGRFLSDLPESSDFAKINDLLEESGDKAPGHYIAGQHMIVASNIWLGNRKWTIGISAATSELFKKTLSLIYNLCGLVLFLGIIVFGLLFALMRLDQARDALQESENRFRALFEGAPDAILLADSESGEILDANQAASELLLRPHEKIVGLNQAQLHPPQMEEYAKEVFFTHAREKEERSSVEFFALRADGSSVPVEISAQKILIQGKPVLQGFFRDITGRKRVEEELKKYREHLEELVKERTNELEKKGGELEHANTRLQELDRLKSMFIASMSHEFRTPLNSIIGFTGIILQGMTGEINPEQRDQLQRVFGSAKHLVALINDVIDISKIEAGKFEVHAEEFNLEEVIREAVLNFISKITDKGLDLEISMPQDIRLMSDRRRVLQCILNYLSNAVKFTEKGNILITAHEVDGTVVIKVKDTGIGIKEDDMPSLFRSFVRLDSTLKIKTPGTGLGLYLTKKIATELLNGSVSVKSAYGEGSTFTIKIPKEI